MSIATPSARLLTELDHIRISKLLLRPALASAEMAASIGEVIDSAELISSYDVPPTLVTMYSQVLVVDAQTGERRKLTLCYPDDAEPTTGFVSVLSPVGSSLLGLSVGETASWRTPHGGMASAKVREILFQPEESGNYLL